MELVKEKFAKIQKEEKLRYIDDFVLERKIRCCRIIPYRMKKLIIYVHPLGKGKEMISYYYDLVKDKNVGFISFDLPGHGDYNLNSRDFTLKTSLVYLEKVISYAKKFHMTPVLFGSGFGAFVILNKLHKNYQEFDRIILDSPILDFYKFIRFRTGVAPQYFDHYESLRLCGVDLYRKIFVEAKRSNMFNVFKPKENKVFVIQGKEDSYVDYLDVEKFCRLKKIDFTLIKGVGHFIPDSDEVVKKFLEDKLFN